MNPLSPKRLVLHADDLGLSRAVTGGILRGFTHGLLTSTSVLANGPDFWQACDDWRELPSRAGQPFDLGVHLNLTQGRPLTGASYPRPLLDRQGRFPGIGTLFFRSLTGGRRWRSAIRTELDAQIQRVLATGLDVTHLNGHQYIELIPTVGECVLELAVEHRIAVVRRAWEPAPPLGWTQFAPRLLAAVKGHYATQFSQRLKATQLRAPDRYFGSSHAGRIDARILELFLQSAARATGALPTVEIALHPGLAAPSPSARELAEGWFDPLAALRPGELALLTSPELPSLLHKHGFTLGRLSNLAAQSERRAAA